MWQEIVHTIPGPGRVDARIGDVVIRTDHPPPDELESRPPTPWLLFLSSIGTCMASFVAAYLREHGLSTEGVRLVQRQRVADGLELVEGFTVRIEVPPDFPEEHRAGLVDAANDCTVKRVMEAGPSFDLEVRSSGEEQGTPST